MKTILVLITTIILAIITIYPKTDLEKKLYHLNFSIHDSTYMSMIDYNTKINIQSVDDKYIITFKGGLPKRFITKDELLDYKIYYEDLVGEYLYYVEQKMEINKNEVDNFPAPSTLVLNRILSFNSGNDYGGIKTISEIRLFTEEDLNIGKQKSQKTLTIIMLISLLFLILFVLIIRNSIVFIKNKK